ncbi:PI31 proteasome regulator-domain-containing protein [Scheffersomyces amazonensis]|uniref:PI31 proteasome regulator-domain-containing protein n=1 Tax=Scheffersomyces amazonensis TaxID=1078765 RepID=UPI00315CB985
MTIDSYFGLTKKLFHNFVEDQYPTSSNKFVHTIVYDKEYANQVQVYLLDESHNKTLIFTYTINPISEIKFVINVVLDEEQDPPKIENVYINWSDSSLTPSPIKFPLDELNLSSNLINSFNLKIKSIISNQRFKELIDSTSRKQEDPNVLHHQLSRSPENEPDRYIPTIPPIGNVSTSASSGRPADMPDFDDEYEIKRPGGPPPSAIFPSIGDDDLNPPGLPRHPELKPYIDPLGTGASSSTPYSGMHPSANHPIFGGPSSGNTSRLGVPPGARYDDPYGEDNLDALGSGLPGNLRGPGGRGPGGSHSTGGAGFPGFNGPTGGGFGF